MPDPHREVMIRPRPLLLTACMVLTMLSGCLGDGGSNQSPESVVSDDVPDDDPGANETAPDDNATDEVDEDPTDPEPGPGPGALPWPVACDPDDHPPHEDLSTSGHRCIGPDAFTVDGRDLGFTDDYDIYDLRPGINMEGCTSSYLLTDEAGDLFLTFSAHCVEDGGDDDMDFCEQPYLDPGSTIEVNHFGEVGTLVWTSGHHMDDHDPSGTDCSDWDAAIVRLDPSVHDDVHPAIRHIGGPIGLADVLTLEHGDPMVGYGNSGDRGFVYSFTTGGDTGHSSTMASANVFEGYFIGEYLEEVDCSTEGTVFECANTGSYGFGPYIRYTPTKITGDSGSADLMADGHALGIVSRISTGGAPMITTPLYDTLLKIYAESGKHYRLVTWDEWSPDTLEPTNDP